MRLLLLSASLLISSFAVCQSPPVVEWERTLGGTFNEEANDLLVEPNSNIIAVGRANSVDGDVTGNHGITDGWFVKLDPSGTTLFTKCIGGSAIDVFSLVLSTGDNGYLCIGYSYSGDMDLPGNNGDADAWMVKLSATGNIEWSRNYGDAITNKFLSAAVLYDGSIAAIMESTAINNPFDIQQRSIVKLDAAGNILWQTVAVTGTSIVETNDHKLLTASGLLVDETSGNTSAVAWNVPGTVALLKKTNGRIYAATKNGMENLAGYLEEGSSYNYVSQVWATDYDYSGGEGATFNTVFNPYPRGIAYLNSPAAYVVAGTQTNYTRGGVFEYGLTSTGGSPLIFQGMYADWERLFAVVALNSGDEYVCAGRKFVSNGNFWIVKYAVNNIIRGNVFFDQNNNNLQDAGEPPFNNVLVRSAKNVHGTFNKTVNGVYSNIVDTGFYTTSPVLSQLPYYSVSPAYDTVTFSSFKNIVTSNFAVQKIADARDYSVSLAAYTPARPGFPVKYKITCTNTGTDTIINKTIQFIKDGHLQLVQTNPLFDALSGDTLSWNVDSVAPGEEAILQIDLTVGTSTTVNIGDTLTSYVSIDGAGDISPANNIDSLLQQVTGSFDPNDKTEIHGETISKLQVQNGEYLQYTIRFQNTGNDTAFNITIRDTLDSRLQWSSAEAISASHSYSLKVKEGRNVECTFPNINLADSGQNEPASHGFVTFRIRPKTTLDIGDVIKNSASIYFDFNAPIKTNIVTTAVVHTTAIWTGAADSLWDNPGNWNINLVPDAETVVIIPANVPNNPVVNTNAVCYALRMDKDGVINIGDGNKLEVLGK